MGQVGVGGLIAWEAGAAALALLVGLGALWWTGRAGADTGRVVVRVDPLKYRCPRCGAGVDERCTRLSGPYGLGAPLRKMHADRFTEARLDQARERRAHHARRVSARRAQES